MSQPADYTLYQRIYLVVQQIPAGQVASYGDVAAVVGGGCDARTVGQALNQIPKQAHAAVPWQRVVNKQGGIRAIASYQLREWKLSGIMRVITVLLMLEDCDARPARSGGEPVFCHRGGSTD